MNTLLERNIELQDEVWYWTEVLSSYTYSGLYTVQSSPIRLWRLGRDVFEDARLRIRGVHTRGDDTRDATPRPLSRRWSQFYSIVRDSVRDRYLANIQKKIMSPITLSRKVARYNKTQLERLRESTASALGIMIIEGLAFDIPDADQLDDVPEPKDWKGVVERNVALIDAVVREAPSLAPDTTEFEDRVFAEVSDDPELSIHVEDAAESKPVILARRLLEILDNGLPGHVESTNQLVKCYGRPSRLVRYWLPVGLTLLSSTTVLRILVNRKADIMKWISDVGVTLRDFYANWVVEPARKVVQTIRHDETSEIALMSRDSLKADLESLERMVVDFAVDWPQFAVDGSLSEAKLDEIRHKVSEGDISPVLRAYEQNLRKLFRGTLRGDLPRALLIQIQQSKVDLKIALSAIDSLLKSQELVFGFVGLTPGILVTIGLFRYLSGVISRRRGVQSGQEAHKGMLILGNIDRILSKTVPGVNNSLPFKEQGLILCEIHVLRNHLRLLPRDVKESFLADLDSLANGNIVLQKETLRKMRWDYYKWLSG
jgi:nuclear-control-of-ATPase protein 2